jgi:SAM-dependent methyltransferase
VSYIHGTEPSEQERLAALNRLTNAPFVRFLGVTKGARVLEVGSGLGILAAEVAAAAEDVHVVGVEGAAAQLAAAVSDPRVEYVLGDAHALRFPDASFDLVYGRYILEHVSDPERVVAEMHRVARVGARVAVCENDVSLMRVDPPCPAFDEVWSAFQRHQHALGGDALVGKRLFRLFRHAGFSAIELSVQPDVHWQGSLGFPGWIHNLIGNIGSARAGLVRSGLCDQVQIDAAVDELTALVEHPDASSQFVWNRALAVR